MQSFRPDPTTDTRGQTHRWQPARVSPRDSPMEPLFKYEHVDIFSHVPALVILQQIPRLGKQWFCAMKP